MESLFSEKTTWFETAPGVTNKGNPHKPQKKTATEHRLFPAAQTMDECHETKSPSTGAMRKFWYKTRANEECKSLFMSGTLWSQSPGELEGIIGVLVTVDWVKDARWKYACDAPFQELVTSYKRLLQREDQVETNLQL